MPLPTESKNAFYLNGTQKNIIDAAISFPIDDIIQTLISEPELAILALMSVVDGSEKNNEIFTEKNISEDINILRNILTHPCPQNRMRGDASAMGNDYEYYPEGVKNGIVYYWKDGFGSQILSEKQGLLGLTGRIDSIGISKEAVVGYILQNLFRTISELQSMTPRLIKLIKQNEEIVKDLMQSCEELTLAKLSLINENGLTILILNPEATIRLLNKARIPIADFLAIDEVLLSIILAHDIPFINLIEEAHWSANEILALPPNVIALCLEYSSQLIQLIKNKQITYNDICAASIDSFFDLIFNEKKVNKLATPISITSSEQEPTTKSDHPEVSDADQHSPSNHQPANSSQPRNAFLSRLNEQLQDFIPMSEHPPQYYNPTNNSTLTLPDDIQDTDMVYYLTLLQRLGLFGSHRPLGYNIPISTQSHPASPDDSDDEELLSSYNYRQTFR